MATLQPTSFTEINRLHQAATARLAGSLVVTSSQLHEGVSTLAYLLALRSAEEGKKTLYIDLNMKNSQITKELGLPAQEWNIAKRTANTIKKLYTPSDTLPTLSFMAAPTDAASVKYLHESSHVLHFLSLVEQDFDHVIIDTTPVTALNRGNADPVVLAAAATRCVLVAAAGVTNRDKLRQAADTLQHAGANVVGVAVNDHANPSRQAVLLDFARRFEKMSPGFHAWLKHRILRAELS